MNNCINFILILKFLIQITKFESYFLLIISFRDQGETESKHFLFVRFFLLLLLVMELKSVEIYKKITNT